MRYPLYIAKRYLFSKSNKNAVNIISRIAVVAVIIGSMALFIVLSGFAGLKDFALQFTNVFDSDVKVTPANGKTLTITPELYKKLQNVEGVDAFSQIIEERVFLQYKGKSNIAYIKGVDENYQKITPVDSLLFAGDWMQPDLDEVITRGELARCGDLGLELHDLAQRAILDPAQEGLDHPELHVGFEQ